jgi:hypothetical protein
MLTRWGDSALTEVEWLVDDGTTFALTRDVHSLVDAERTSFAGRVARREELREPCHNLKAPRDGGPAPR